MNSKQYSIYISANSDNDDDDDHGDTVGQIRGLANNNNGGG